MKKNSVFFVCNSMIYFCNMIEVEIRGELSKEKFLELKKVFDEKGKLIEIQDRE